MKRSPSPLRYPGGKSTIYEMTNDIITSHNLESCQYAEPYAGGCGLALSLLFNDVVQELHLNDIDVSIATFWEILLKNPEELANRIEMAKLDMDEWFSQKEVQKHKNTADKLDLAFSTLYLNRTNRSGVLKGGVIGGKNQNGNYKLDCRFNKDALVKKVFTIAENSHKIRIYNMDAIDFISHLENLELSKPLLMVDPPYYNKGQSLYTNFYKHDDHVGIANKLSETKLPWLLTYDNTPEISNLYSDYAQYHFNINYSAQIKRVGSELLIASSYFGQLAHPRLTAA